MAVDTRDKRASCIGLGLPVPSVLPQPDGDIDAPDRLQVAFCYAGIAVAEAIVLWLWRRSA